MRRSRVRAKGPRGERQKVALAVRSILGLPLIANFALAQQTPQSAQPNIEEIVVTAQRREQSLQDVPISVTALGGDDLEARGATGFADYLRDVPGVSFIPLGAGIGQLNIRGVETQPVARDQPGVKPAVGVYLDDTPISTAFFNPDLDIFDMARIEVLRGPQGTLFGAGSLAGTIRYITNKPKANVFEAGVDAGYGAVHTGGNSYDVKGMLNIPLLADRAAMRLVAYETQEGGYIDQVQIQNAGHTYGVAGNNVNEVRKNGFRVELEFKDDYFDSVFSGMHQTISSSGYPLEDIKVPNIPACNGCSPYTVAVAVGPNQQFRQRREGHDEDISSFSANLSMNLEFANLVSASAFTTRNIHDSRDYSSTLDSFGPAYAYPGDLVDVTGLSVFSQELRITSQKSSIPLDWIAGIFYSQQNRTYNQYLYEPGIDAALGINSLTLGAASRDSLYDADFTIPFREDAAFAEATYHFTPEWGLTGGVRAYQYSESVTSDYRGYFGTNGGVPHTTSSKASGGNPRAILTYQPESTVLISAQAAKGFRLGSSNDPLPALLCGNVTAPPQYGPEHIWNYELNAKTQFMDRRVTLSGALYQINYTDIQLNARLNTCSFSFITNGATARSRGAELELGFRPVDPLSLSLNATYQNPKLTSNLPSVVATLLPGVGSGSRLPGSPRETFNAAADYALPPIVGSFAPYGHLNYQYVGGVKTYIQDPDSLDTRKYSLGSVRLGLRRDNLDVSVYADNLWNTRAQLSLERENGGEYSYAVNAPRTIGFLVRSRF